MNDRDRLLDEGERKGGDDPVLPYRVQLNFVTAHMDPHAIDEMAEGLIEDGEARGLIFSYGYSDRMASDDVIPDSKLDKIVRGEDDDDEEQPH